jgi:transcriptional regulator with XRE-family HTH domain
MHKKYGGFMDIVDRIKELCAKRSLTVSLVEQAVSLGNGTIGKWKRQSPSVNNLMLVADYLNVSLDYLAIGKKDDSLILTPKERELVSYFRLLSNDRQNKEIGRLSGIIEEQRINASSETAEEFAGRLDAQKKQYA